MGWIRRRRRAGAWIRRLPSDTRDDVPGANRRQPPGGNVDAVTSEGDDAGQPGPDEAIRLDDGTWEDLGPDGRWRPSSGDRARAAVILTVFFVALLGAALIASVDDGDGAREEAAAEAATTTTTEPATTTTTEPPDPSSIDGEPASPRCRDDDRNALPLRDRQDSTVLVLNGTYRNGHAGDTTEALEALGYTSVVPDNAGREQVTVVAYKNGFCAEAERLAQDLRLPRAVIERAQDDLDVVVGRARLIVTLGLDSV